ncbi:MAG: hypothetical protein JXR97_00575 [Planctomycetes bacterium]|nr:hypothetical protein [Planctomycetota bacterium]
MKIDFAICDKFHCQYREDSHCHLVRSHNEIAEHSGDELWVEDEVPDNCINYVEYIKVYGND